MTPPPTKKQRIDGPSLHHFLQQNPWRERGADISYSDKDASAFNKEAAAEGGLYNREGALAALHVAAALIDLQRQPSNIDLPDYEKMPAEEKAAVARRKNDLCNLRKNNKVTKNQGERGATPTTGEKEVAQEPVVKIEETEVAQLHTELQRRELIAKLQAELKRRELPAELQRRRELGEDKYAATTDVADKKVPKKTCLTKKASKTMPGAPPRPYTTYNIFFQLEREYILQHGERHDIFVLFIGLIDPSFPRDSKYFVSVYTLTFNFRPQCDS